MISQLVLLKQAADLHSSTINQMAVFQVASDCFETHVPMLRRIYAARRDAMLRMLVEHMPEGVDWTRPEGGMFVWVTLPEDMNGTDLLTRALETVKLAFVPGQAFFPDDTGTNMIRLSFSNSDEAAIREGIRRLGKVLCA